MSLNPQPAQAAAIESFEHGDEILGQHSLFLHRGAAVGIANAVEHSGNMAVRAIELLAEHIDRAFLREQRQAFVR